MMSRGRLLFALLALATLILDQATKAIMTRSLAPHGSITVIPGLFDLTYVHNRGAIFGLFSGLTEPWRAILLTIVPLAAIAVVLVITYRTPASHVRPLAALGLVLGGALGNLIDRIRLGEVVDFLDWHLAGYHWPAFNVADSAICIGVGLLILHLSRT